MDSTDGQSTINAKGRLPDDVLQQILEQAVRIKETYDAQNVSRSSSEINSSNNETSRWMCSNPFCYNGGSMVHDRDGDITCTRCGLVQEQRICSDGMFHYDCMRTKLHHAYKPLSHALQKLSQIIGTTPSIPHDILEICDKEYKLGDYSRHKETMSRDAVAEILKNVEVPMCIAEKYRSKRYKKALCTDLHRQKYFSERWVYFRWRWLRAPSPQMTNVLVDRLCIMFEMFNTSFMRVCVNSKCEYYGKCRCNGQSGFDRCYKNRPPYYMVFGHIFRVIQKSEDETNSPFQLVKGYDKTPDIFKIYMPFMPCLRLSTYKKFNFIIKKVFVALGWSHAFEAITFETKYTHEWTFGLRPK